MPAAFRLVSLVLSVLLPLAFCLLASTSRLLSLVAAVQQQPAPPPISVKIVEPDDDPIGLANVVIGALGLSGAMAVAAILLGVLLAGVLFFVRSRQPLR